MLTDLRRIFNHEAHENRYYGHGPPHLSSVDISRPSSLWHLSSRLLCRRDGLLWRRRFHLGCNARRDRSSFYHRMQRGFWHLPGGLCSCLVGSDALGRHKGVRTLALDLDSGDAGIMNEKRSLVLTFQCSCMHQTLRAKAGSG